MTDRSKPLILIIDDEEAIRQSMQSFLEDENFDVISAQNGRIGLEKFEQYNPDMVLVDLRMPEVDGLEVLANVRKTKPNTPIIVVSGTGVIADAVEAVHLGAWDFLLKPIYDMSILQHAMDKALERARLIEENRRYQEHLEEEVAIRTKELIAINEQLNQEIKIRIKTENALRESEQKLNSIIKTVPDIVYRLNKEGKISFISDACRKFGYDPEDLLGTDIMDYVHPDDLEKAKYRLNERRTGDRRTKKLEIRLFSKYRLRGKSSLSKVNHGQEPIFLVEAEGIYTGETPTTNTFFGTQGIIRDITERIVAEKALVASEERLKLALRGADLGLWDSDLQTKEVYYDSRTLQMLGYKKDECDRLKPFRDTIMHPDDKQRAEQALEDHISGKTPFYEMELRLKSKWGEWIWVLDRGMVVARDGNGNPLRIAGTFLDISTRKKAELEKEELHLQLAQAQKMESIGTLAGGVAHDFNNLLTVINGHAELALLKKDTESMHKDIRLILSSANRAAELTRQLLAFSRKQVIEPVVLDINKVIHNVENMMRRLIGEDISIQTVLGENLPNVEADPGQVEQVIMNLVINARDAINEVVKKNPQKIITIETGLINLNDDFASHHPGSSKGLHLLLKVSDTGTGMTEEVKDKIFEPFFSTKAEKGTGLGLSTVYGIVRQNDGLIHVESEPGEGTVFSIYWPVSEKSTAAELPKEKGSGELRGSERILVVEDEPQVRDFTSNALKDFGYEVFVAEDGEKALALLDTLDNKIDLLVSDMVMPNMSGKELSEQIRKIIPEIKILITSGYTDDEERSHQRKASYVKYLPKPFSVHGLLLKVKEMLKEK